jgi:protein transport protein SEC24
VVNVSLASLRDQLTDQAVGALAAYRKFCASNNPPGQLILPESCKLYPLFTMCILKHRAFRPGTEITSDFRIFEMRRIRDMNVQTSINYFYPRMFSLTDLPEDSCEFSAALNRFVMPPYQRTCGEKVFDNGAYLLGNFGF